MKYVDLHKLKQSESRCVDQPVASEGYCECNHLGTLYV